MIPGLSSDKSAKLAKLLISDLDFGNAFKKTHTEDKEEIKAHQTSAGGQDHVETLLQQSRQFVVKDRIHLYSDSDPVLFVREPVGGRKQSAVCRTCDLKFESAKQMNYCNFCGTAHCEKCFVKQRPFYGDGMPQMIPTVNGTKQVKEQPKQRGRICLLCDRKYHINAILCESVNKIDV